MEIKIRIVWVNFYSFHANLILPFVSLNHQKGVQIVSPLYFQNNRRYCNRQWKLSQARSERHITRYTFRKQRSACLIQRDDSFVCVLRKRKLITQTHLNSTLNKLQEPHPFRENRTVSLYLATEEFVISVVDVKIRQLMISFRGVCD